jgi:hypothetical protein
VVRFAALMLQAGTRLVADRLVHWRYELPTHQGEARRLAQARRVAQATQAAAAFLSRALSDLPEPPEEWAAGDAGPAPQAVGESSARGGTERQGAAGGNEEGEAA